MKRYFTTSELTWHYTDHHRRQCHCGLRVFAHRSTQVAIIATESPDNPGMSITNAAELLWPGIIRAYPGSENAILIEHYKHEELCEESTDQGDFDQVILLRPLRCAIEGRGVTWFPLRNEKQWRNIGLLDVAESLGLRFNATVSAGERHG